MVTCDQEHRVQPIPKKSNNAKIRVSAAAVLVYVARIRPVSTSDSLMTEKMYTNIGYYGALDINHGRISKMIDDGHLQPLWWSTPIGIKSVHINVIRSHFEGIPITN